MCEIKRDGAVRYYSMKPQGDDRDKIADKISEVLKEADLILTTGGVSVGR